MSYTCHNHDEHRGWVLLPVQDGWNDNGSRRMRLHQPNWADIQCGHVTSHLDPQCKGCKWRNPDEEKENKQ